MITRILRLLVFLALLVLYSCGPLREVPVRTIERVIEKMVPVRVDSADAIFISKFECDSVANAPRMVIEKDSTHGNILQNVTYNAGQLTVLSRVPP